MDVVVTVAAVAGYLGYCLGWHLGRDAMFKQAVRLADLDERVLPKCDGCGQSFIPGVHSAPLAARDANASPRGDGGDVT
jgi:hypothetical protein